MLCRFGGLLCGLVCVVGLAAETVSAQALRYNPQPGSRMVYRFEIAVETATEFISLQGTTTYDVEAVTDDQVRLVYKGHLTETKKDKPNLNSGRRFSSIVRMRDPFGEPKFGGKIPSTNRITINKQGKVLELEGDSQLPYMLGHLSLLPFEPLPDDEQRKWEVTNDISISEPSTRDRLAMINPFFANGVDRDKKVRVAKETTRYEVMRHQNNVLRIKKAYDLLIPPPDPQHSQRMQGVGEWQYHQDDHLPHAMDFAYQLLIRDDNVSLTVPIKLSYRRLSDADVKALDAKNAKLAADNKMRRAAAEAKAAAPLTAEEKAEALAGLRAAAHVQQMQALQQLNAKTPDKLDRQIVDAVRPLLQSSHRSVQILAKMTLVKWDPDFKRINELQEKYSRSAVVESTGRKVDATTHLFAGQIVQVHEHGAFWKPAIVAEVQPHGLVLTKNVSIPERTTLYPRAQIQLAPPELPQPEQPRRLPASRTKARTWTDASGQHKIEAELLRKTDSDVVLLRQDGREVTLPIEKLSKTDQTFLRRVPTEQEEVENPFEP